MIQRGTYWMFAAAILMVTVAASGTTIRHADFDEMVRLSQFVVRGKCISSEARWDRGNIWTFSTVELLETFKGNAPLQILVRLPGGKVGHMTSTVDAVPQFREGEDLVLFLLPTGANDFSVTGWSQGTFRIWRDSSTGKEMVTQDSAAFSVFDAATKSFKVEGFRNMPIEQFRIRVREVVERQRTGRLP